MTTDQILLALASENYHVALTHFNQPYMKPNCWHLSISREENPSFRLNSEDSTLEGAVQLGWKRWQALQGGLEAALAIGVAPTLSITSQVEF